MRITDVHDLRKGLSQLYLDGEPAVKVDTVTLSLSKFHTGAEISDEELQLLLQQSGRHRAKEKGLYLLEHRAYSCVELQQKLALTQGKEFALYAAQSLQQAGLIDDEAFARDYARMLLERKHMSRRGAAYELKAKGIDPQLIEEILDGLFTDEPGQILELLQKKYPGALQPDADEKTVRRAYGALMRLGYSAGAIKQVLKDRDEYEY